MRLAALVDSPSAFGSTRDREQLYSEENWRAWRRDVVTFLAFRSGAPLGIVASINGEEAEVRTLVAMWANPASVAPAAPG